jgi:hypothetical protein
MSKRFPHIIAALRPMLMARYIVPRNGKHKLLLDKPFANYVLKFRQSSFLRANDPGNMEMYDKSVRLK